MSKKKKEFDKIKTLRKINRDETGPYGKAGPHSDKRERRIRRMSTQDWLEIAEEDTPFWMDGGPGEELLDSETNPEIEEELESEQRKGD